MEKLKMQSPDLTQKNIEAIEKLFPNVITEVRDETGKLKKPSILTCSSKNFLL